MAQRFGHAVVATNKWRMSEDAGRAPGLIGPNAILQLLPVLDEFLGQPGRDKVFKAAGVLALPDGNAMIPETDAFHVHRELRRQHPAAAPEIAKRAGINTAKYILANRIPRPAQWVLKTLPAAPSAKMLSAAIAKHAWTFVGSGSFRVVSPWMFEIRRNPLIRGETSEDCLCHWHAAVFERLYQVLVSPGCTCVETQCVAQGCGNTCSFEISRNAL